MTSLQHDPSAHRPWTKRMLGFSDRGIDFPSVSPARAITHDDAALSCFRAGCAA